MAEGMAQGIGEQVSFNSNQGRTGGYLAVPTEGSGPALVLIHEWWGLVGHVRHVADRFADAGFVTLVPDLYHGVQTGEPDEAMRLLMGLAMDAAARDIEGATAYLSGHPAVSSPGLGAVGFSMGGSLAVWSATVAENVEVTVGFYPAVPWERMAPDWPRYDGKRALIHCDEEDGLSEAPRIQLARDAIEAAGGTVQTYDYPGTHHAFFNDDRPEVHDPTAARLAWTRTIEFLRQHLG